MARAVEQIERDIAALEKSVEAIAQEFYATYSDYLIALGQVVRQQLIMVAYYVCTQGYPDRFLKLSLSQRQEFQQAVRQLAKQAQTQLIEQLEAASSAQLEPADQSDSDDLLSNLEKAALEDDSEGNTYVFFEADEPMVDDEPDEPLQPSERSPDPELQPPDSEPAPQPVNLPSPQIEPDAQDLSPSNPESVVRWQENLEKLVLRVLQTLSHSANRLLQQTDILPNKLPAPILEVAAKAGVEAIAGHPNLLNLLIETETDDNDSRITHVMAVRLRLSEMEFNDSTLTTWRSRIRGLLTRLNHLGREYQKKQREKAIAQAEAAWRSSWFED